MSTVNLMRPVETGVVALFTLKNPSQPEFFARVPAPGGCLSVDIHRDATHFLAIGLGDGNVAVYNAQNSEQQYFSQNYVKSKHHGPVTQVKFTIKKTCCVYVFIYWISYFTV